MRNRLGTGVLALALATVVAGCGGGASGTPAGGGASQAPAASAPSTEATPATGTEATPASGAGAAVDVCSMLSPADVKAVTGADTTAAVEGTDWADWVAGECWWNSADLKTRFSIDVGTPASIAKADPATAQEQLDLSRMAYQGFGKIEDVAGLGDGGFYVAGFVVAIKNGSMLELTALNMPKDQAIALAKKVADKI